MKSMLDIILSRAHDSGGKIKIIELRGAIFKSKNITSAAIVDVGSGSGLRVGFINEFDELCHCIATYDGDNAKKILPIDLCRMKAIMEDEAKEYNETVVENQTL